MLFPFQHLLMQIAVADMKNSQTKEREMVSPPDMWGEGVGLCVSEDSGGRK